MDIYYRIFLTITLLMICFISLQVACHKSKSFLLQINMFERIDIFSPILLFPFAYSVLYSVGSFNFLKYDIVEVPIYSYIYYFTGLLSYYLGLILVSKIYKANQKVSYKKQYEKEFAFILSGFLILLCFSIVVFAKAGIPIFQNDVVNSRTLVVKTVGGWLYYMYKTLPLFTALLLILKWKYAANKSIIILINYLLPIGFLFMVLGAYRGAFVSTFLLLLITYHYMIKAISLKRAITIFVCLISVYAFMGYIRAQPSNYSGGWFQVLLIELSNPSKALALITSRIPNEFPFFKGSIIVNAFMALLPGEQLAYGLILKDMFSLHFSGGGFTPSLLGGFYLDFGILGIIMFMAFYGIVLGYLYYKMKKIPTPYNIVIYAFALQYFIISIIFKFFIIFFSIKF